MQTGDIRVWDLPTRLFHWCLAALVIAAIVTAHVGGNALEWHFRIGYSILTLVGFRLIWGFVGGRYARFASFVRRPSTILAAARGTVPADASPGHNPIGGLSVLAMLALIGAQASAGLFANDDIASEGPLAHLVSKAASDALTLMHKLNEKLIIALIVVHVIAIAFYRLRKGQDLVRPMITGDKRGIDPSMASRDDAALRLRAALLLAACAAIVWLVVKTPAS